MINQYFQECISTPYGEEFKTKLSNYLSKDIKFNAGHPINALNSIEEVGEKFWKPLKTSFKNLKRIEHISFDGVYAYNNQNWITMTGRYVGQFVEDLYTIPATKKSAHLRFGEFYCIENDKIVESYIILDYIHLMKQTDVCLLPKTLGSDEDVPGSQIGDGLGLLKEADEALSKKNMKLVVDMLTELHVDRNSSSQKSYWADDMIWYGPSGIGTFYGLDGFSFYRKAFINTFPNRKGGCHKTRFAKNNYVCSTGWPSMYATHMGSGWFGLAPTNKDIFMRIMDWWRVEDNMLVENWVLIDMIHLFLQLGLDLFANIDYIHNKKPFEIILEQQPDILHKFENDLYHKENMKLSISKHVGLY